MCEPPAFTLNWTFAISLITISTTFRSAYIKQSQLSFADDTNLSCDGFSPIQIEQKLHPDLKKVHDYTSRQINFK